MIGCVCQGEKVSWTLIWTKQANSGLPDREGLGLLEDNAVFLRCASTDFLKSETKPKHCEKGKKKLPIWTWTWIFESEFMNLHHKCSRVMAKLWGGRDIVWERSTSDPRSKAWFPSCPPMWQNVLGLNTEPHIAPDVRRLSSFFLLLSLHFCPVLVWHNLANTQPSACPPTKQLFEPFDACVWR